METPLATDARALLCRLLAQADAVFRPCRSPGTPAWGRLWRLRRDYCAQGLPWHSEGVGATGRKAGERLLARLAAAGWVRVFRLGGRVVAARLSARGEGQARRSCRLPSLGTALELLDEISALHRELGGMGDRGGDGPWLPESLLCRLEWGGEDFAVRAFGVELHALPLLTAGLLVTNSTGLGHAYYRLTAAGEAQAAARARAATVPTATRVEWAWQMPATRYTTARTEYREGLENSTERGQEIGAIPLPVNGWSAGFAERYRAKMKAISATGR